ncbi:probable inactive histone-lysine N-methyltransferase SUVR1 [Eutrema salsugineum]|uniref:probable inactive histone-lysine N-methyltransferase SUVR1 n=1 Tax=Eutrema salsugineum TaxID=72664 RepID=UPI000CECFB5F|nr:probable inactive histone-lysine N-methyltransferase SUVR1 [Eutrema salsugineum]
MAPDPRIKKACIAMKAFDIPESKVRPIIRQLRKSYDNKWNFIEQDNYRVLIDAIFDEEDVQATEKKKEEEKESNVCSLAMTRGKKRALEQTQLVVKDEEDDIEEEEFPLKRRLRRKRDGVCDNNTSIGIGKPTSKKPNEEDRNLEEEEEEEDEDDEKTEPPPLKRYSRRAGESGSARTVYNNTSPSFSTPMSVEPEELPPITLLPADPVVAEKASDSGALIVVKNEPFTDHKPIILENCSAPVLEMEKSNTDVEERDEETNVTLNVTTAMDVPPSETVSDMIKVGDESGAADISMGLVIVPECEISADGWRAFSNTKDITGGEENIQIPWVNEINDEVPSRFRYIPHSFVFQDAAVKLFSVSSFSDDQSCFFCIGDCLDTSSTPCSCTTAYTVEGVLKEDVLEARISEARDQRKQVLQFCQECPLEKAKKEEILEPCKGHIKRKAIKECWIKCGCAKRCGNRLVQRGIHNKLEVFFTPNGKGWGVRTLERLAQGSFVCEYAGEILTITELYQRRSENELTSPVILDAHWGSEECLEDDKSLCLDGTGYGNISRFLNHRCLDANLIEIPVQVETPYQHYYRLAFFTTRDIEAMEELTWDYGIDFNDEDCLMKHFDCVCGSRFCRNIKQAKKAKKIMIRA